MTFKDSHLQLALNEPIFKSTLMDLWSFNCHFPVLFFRVEYQQALEVVA